MHPFWQGLIGSALAGSATALGALPIFFFRSLSDRVRDALLGFGAGVMLAAVSFSLVIPGLAAAEPSSGRVGASLIVALGILIGGAFVWVAHGLLPHEHLVKGVEGKDAQRLRRIWLFLFAITLHNFPEGLAVGGGFGAGDTRNGIALALGIGLQNIPEGFAVAVALLGVRSTTPVKAFGVALLSGLVEPVGGALGAGVVSFSALLLPWGLAFAAGAMLFVISHEIIPETHAHGNEKHATAGLLVGFVTMMVLDVSLAA
jgi:ZIP family zinc transporter